jgi:hypothetical protein
MTLLGGALVLLLVALWSVANISDAAETTPQHSTPAKTKPDLRGTKQQPLIVAPAVDDERGTAEHHLVVESTSVKTDADVAQERADRAERDNADWWVKAVGIATIVILLFQGIAFWIQIRKLTESISEMKNATEATRDAADAERATVTMMDKTARRQLTAYVFLESHDLQFTAGLPATVKIVLKNFGQTPAYGISIAGGAYLGNAFDPANTPETALLPQFPNVAPGQTAFCVLSAEGAVTGPQQDAMSAGAITLTVWATVRYKDTFGDDRFLKIRLMSGRTQGFAWGQLVPCDGGNETDMPARELPPHLQPGGRRFRTRAFSSG